MYIVLNPKFKTKSGYSFHKYAVKANKLFPKIKRNDENIIWFYAC